MKKFYVKAHRNTYGDSFRPPEKVNIEEIVEAETTEDAKWVMLEKEGFTDIWIDTVQEI